MQEVAVPGEAGGREHRGQQPVSSHSVLRKVRVPYFLGRIGANRGDRFEVSSSLLLGRPAPTATSAATTSGMVSEKSKVQLGEVS